MVSAMQIYLMTISLSCFITMTLTLSSYIFKANERCGDHPCDCCKNRECAKQDEDHFTCDGCIEGLTGSNCIFRCPANCLNCSQKFFENDRICEVCKEGYYNGRYLDRESLNVHNDCSLQCKNGCVLCTAYNRCIKCQAGYYITAQHVCVNCTRHCEMCIGASHCEKCINGYFSYGTACQLCSSICRTCYSYDICSSCRTAHYLNEHTCSLCMPGCVSCNNSSTCDFCEKGYYLRQDSCVKCSDNCLDCHADEVGDQCRVCEKKYYVALGSCHKCDNVCAECLPDGICTACEKDFKLVNGQCHKCNDNCTKCQDGVYDINGECNACPSNCANCSSNGACENCLDGFYGLLCSNECPENCLSCRKKDGQCSECKTGSYLNKNEQCINCLERCITCESEHMCSQCEDGFRGRTCRCPKHCVCDGEDICTSCEDGYTGEMCDQQCSSGCSGNVCSKQTGECPNGCLAGKEQPDGDDTSGQLTRQSVFVSVGMILGSAIVSFTIACLVGIYIYKMRRRAFRGKRTQNELTNFQRKGPRACTQSDLIDIDEYMEPSVSNTLERRNLANNTHSRGRIPLSDFAEYVLKKTRAEFMDEFKDLPRSLKKPYKESQKKHNIRKNRYRGIYPYDKTRIVLKSGDSNFINANYIDGYKRRKAYIVSVGPTKTYMGDMSAFWRMVWQEKCSRIVMLCSLTEPKSTYISRPWGPIHLQVNTCDQYWPEKNNFARYGEVTVVSLTEEVNNNYTVRRFEMQMNSERRVVTHFQLTSWSENSVPTEFAGLVTFRQEVNKTQTEKEEPMVVHCSAGVGRTGTYVALDILTQEGDAEGHVDVFNCVKQLREQRTKMVATVDQYEYLHRALISPLSYYMQLPSTSAARSESTASVNQYVDIDPYSSLSQAI